MQKPLYTIGHGTRKSEDFLVLLQTHGIEYLIDVRSQPNSRFNPQYNRAALEEFLESHGIRYVFMGDALGGRPKDPSCYAATGKVDYGVLKTKEFFRQGIARLQTAYSKGISLAIMCSESNPQECHRTKLIGNVLDEKGIVLMHVDAHGNLKDHATVISGKGKSSSDLDLFGNQ